MSHPNPYLFPISRMVLQACSRMDISASARSYRCRMSWIQECFHYVWSRCIVLLLYERDLLYIIFIRTLIVVNFNVSSTEYNPHAKLPRYV
jgi:hypothetical protein